MYTPENYLWGLVGYYLGCTLVLLYLWRFRKLIPGRYFRHLVLLLIAAILLVPVTAYPDGHHYAPAWFVSLYEGFTEATEQGYLRGGRPILMVYGVSVIFYLFGLIIFRRKSQPDNEADTEQEPAQ